MVHSALCVGPILLKLFGSIKNALLLFTDLLLVHLYLNLTSRYRKGKILKNIIVISFAFKFIQNWNDKAGTV